MGFLKSIRDYFNLASPADEGYNFVVATIPPGSKRYSVKYYLEPYSEYESSRQTADAIMTLANTAGITKGRAVISPAKRTSVYTEGDFKLKLHKDGRLLVKCDAGFAEKIRKLPCVDMVEALNWGDTTASAPKPDAPKQ